ncbi:putative protein kinase [Cyclospora cayetanensis]|uniref:non-specific serine/threonine protein kinase n=1 Tax=Cyclospora cayetanensis TaxID=88456 RepID=A0A1D3CR40_9EIME|nr:putative protein kinase [Cyclospora cayetanensis]
MAGAFVHERPQGLVAGNGLGRGVAVVPSPCKYFPTSGSGMRGVSPVGVSSGGLPGPRFSSMEENLQRQGKGVSPVYSRLQIYCPEKDGGLHRGAKRGPFAGAVLQPNSRRPRGQSPTELPSKYELAAVAALCKTPAVPSPSRSRGPPQPCPFPAACSFVPGNQHPCGKPLATAGMPQKICSSPVPFVRRPERGVKWGGQEPMLRKSRSPYGAQWTPLAIEQAPKETPVLPEGAPWMQQKRFAAQSFVESGPLGGKFLLGGSPRGLCSDSCMCAGCPCSPEGLHQAPQAFKGAEGCTMYGKPCIRNQDAAPWTSGWSSAANGRPFATVRPVQQQSLTAYTPPCNVGEGGLNGTEPSPQVEAVSSLSPLPKGLRLEAPAAAAWGLEQPGALPATRGKEESGPVIKGDTPADVVTVYGTDRFWELLECLMKLQQGPSSLLSSSVTFDSTLLAGGGLLYSLIEEGSFGRVFVGSHNESKVAIKVPVEAMLKSDAVGVLERILNEWKILLMCRHPNIVQLVGGIVHGPFDVWLVTRLADGSDLHSRKYSRDPSIQRRITPAQGLFMCRQLAAGVAYLHTPIPGVKPVVVHRDIKPENVLVADDWRIQLCDFGDAEASEDGQVSRISGATWFYAPAELLRSCPVECMGVEEGPGGGSRALPSFNEKWDIWSMGCVFHEMFGFFNPMHVHISSRDSPGVIYKKLKKKALANALVPAIADEIQGIARHIILSCLHPDPAARPSAAEVLQMWSARDEDILKDMHINPNNNSSNNSASNSLGNGYCSAADQMRFPAVSVPQQHLSSNTAQPYTMSGSRCKANGSSTEWGPRHG